MVEPHDLAGDRGSPNQQEYRAERTVRVACHL
jgi:hypothetical protein